MEYRGRIGTLPGYNPSTDKYTSTADWKYHDRIVRTPGDVLRAQPSLQNFPANEMIQEFSEFKKTYNDGINGLNKFRQMYNEAKAKLSEPKLDAFRRTHEHMVTKLETYDNENKLLMTGKWSGQLVGKGQTLVFSDYPQ